MSKKLTFAFSLAMAVLPFSAHALGLGEIKLNSALNDKFSADIQVVGATSDELDSLDVKLANLAQFTQAGLDHPGVLDQLQFVVVRNPDGTAYVHISSTQAVREPFLDFLIDANWNNGELIREYTVLLNPPSFQTANAAKPAPAPAAATQPPAPVAAAPVPVPVPATAPAQSTAPAAVAAAPASSTQQVAPPASASVAAPEAAASPPTAPAPSVEQAPAQRALGANYGPIHRGETLSGIAKSVRPEGVTLNQMMIAIYQANPEVFMHNINRMKAGYILRMPSASDAQAVSVTDANAQVREQIEAWRNRTPTETTPPAAASGAPAAPALQLVAPSSAAESNAPVPGAATQGNGETAVKGTKPGKQPESPAAPPLPPPPSQAPIAVKNNALASVQQQAAQQSATPSPNVLPPPAAATNIPLPKATPEPKPAVTSAPAESGGGIMDLVFSIYSLLALIAIAVIVLLVVMIKKRKGKSPAPSSPGRIKGADWLKQEQAGGSDTTEGSSTTRTKAGKAKKSAAADAMEKTVLTDAATELASGDSDKTMLMAAPPSVPTGDTMIGGAPADTGSAKLDVSDPMAEADFHMAYGLYDQAADVLKKALRQEPGRRELQLKLLEVFFTAGDKNNFVGEAKKLRAGMGDAPDKDWESVAIMGRQVAPGETLFTASGAPAGGGAVDIALDGGGTGTVVGDLDALGGAFTSEPPQAPAPAPAADNSMDFSLPDLEPPIPEPAPAPAPAAAPAADGGLEFNMGDLNFEPTPAAAPPKAAEKKTAPTLGTDEPTVATDFGTDSQVEFDKALNDLASFVNTNVPAQVEDAADPGHDKTMAIRPPKGSEPAAAEPVAAAEEAGGSSISEIGTKLDLARAYIDMGDPDGAKSILEEVIGEGSPQQKQEAQELLKHVS